MLQGCGVGRQFLLHKAVRLLASYRRTLPARNECTCVLGLRLLDTGAS